MKTQRYSFLLKNKLRLTILVMIFATGIVLSVFLFTLYSLSQVRKADELNITYLSQISGSADILHEQVNALNNAVFTDFNIFRVMSQRTVDRLAEAVAVRRLKAIKSSYTYVRFVGVINPFLGRYITNAGVFTEYGFDADTLALLSGEDVRALSMARVIGKTYPLSDISDAAYTFVAKSSPHSKYLKNALTVVDINQDYLNALIGSLDSSAGQHRKLRPQQIIVFDQNGQIVSHTGQRYVPATMGGHMKDMYFAGRLEEMGGGVESGSFIAAETGTSRAESGVKQLITYVKSVKTGWTFVSIQPYSVLLNDVHVFGALTALFLAALFVLSVFLSQKIASSIHNPIKAMVEKFADTAPAGPIDEINLLGDIFTKTVSRAKNLEDTLTASLGAAKITYVNYLLKGEVEKVENALPVYENLGIGLFNVYFLTVLSEIADIPAPGTMTSGAESSGSLNGAEDADSLLRAFVMENIATELLSEICKISYVQAGSSRAVILLYLNQPEAPPALDAALNKLSEIMEQYFNSRVISYVSGITDNWRDISGCYDSLVMACGMRLLREKRAVLYCHGRNVRDELLHNFVVKQYPKKLLNRLFENIQAGSPDTLAAVDEIMEFFADMSLYYAQNYCRHIMLSIFSKFDAYIGVSDEKLIELFSGIEKIDECATFESLHRVFSAYVDGCMRSLEWKKKNINNNAVEKVADYVSKHYGDCNISLNGMAAMVGLSSVYLGKIFASVKGVAFTEYLNSIRLERAAELLTNTRMHITAISESVGVASPNYFYTIFRKKYGVTPANYRKAQNGSDPNS